VNFKEGQFCWLGRERYNWISFLLTDLVDNWLFLVGWLQEFIIISSILRSFSRKTKLCTMTNINQETKKPNYFLTFLACF
jgi:hypothetical protein